MFSIFTHRDNDQNIYEHITYFVVIQKIIHLFSTILVPLYGRKGKPNLSCLGFFKSI